MRTVARQRSRWAEAEDMELMRMVQIQESEGRPRDWNGIAAHLAGRSNKDCRKRWLKLKGAKKVGEWDENENERLREGVKEHGFRWVQVEDYVRTRTADQCASRWQNHIDPNLNHNEWQLEEDRCLLHAFEIYGSNWKMIQSLSLKDRSLQDIRNRYRHLRKAHCVNGAPTFNSPLLEFDTTSGLGSESSSIFEFLDAQYMDQRDACEVISRTQTNSDWSSSQYPLCDDSSPGDNGAWKDDCDFPWSQEKAELGCTTVLDDYYQISDDVSPNSAAVNSRGEEMGDADALNVSITLDGADMNVLDGIVKTLNAKNTRFTITINNKETRSQT